MQFSKALVTSSLVQQKTLVLGIFKIRFWKKTVWNSWFGIVRLILYFISKIAFKISFTLWLLNFLYHTFILPKPHKFQLFGNFVWFPGCSCIKPYILWLQLFHLWMIKCSLVFLTIGTVQYFIDIYILETSSARPWVWRASVLNSDDSHKWTKLVTYWQRLEIWIPCRRGCSFS